MRKIAVWILAIGLAGSPAALARNGDGKDKSSSDSTKKEDKNTGKTEKSAAPVPTNPELAAELEQMRALLKEQTDQLEQQRREMAELKASLNHDASAPNAASPAPTASESAPTVVAGAGTPGSASARNPGLPQGEEASPLQFRIGTAYITPVGFMDFTTVFRSKDGGSGIGTNFANIPYGVPNVFQSNLSEFRFSMQNSRVGFRVDAMVKGAHVIGYMESDYLGNNPGNVAVSSNSNTFRSRLYWVDVSKGKFEVLGGQTWSLITPNRTGISPLPGNLFFSNNIDVNYQAGLTWGRIPELRFVYHPSSKVAIALALDSPEQYAGGSAGGGTITYPAALGIYNGGELNTGGTTLTVPNLSPDIILKLALDPSPRFHIEAGGMERQFHVWNPNTLATFTKTGGGVFLNLNGEIFKGFRLIANTFWSDGGGRYIFGQAPDLIVRADGNVSPIHTGSTVSGFEYTHKNFLLYAYYGGIYIQRNLALDLNGITKIGYGYAGSPSAQNRTIQEETFGVSQALWKDSKYGALNLMGQYSFLSRNPWFVATGNPSNASLSMLFFDLRYTLPGSAPAMK
jgi:flagellar motor protein MotB